MKNDSDISSPTATCKIKALNLMTIIKFKFYIFYIILSLRM